MNFEIEGLIRKHFRFLVDGYGFTYKDRTFSTDKLEIRIILEREPPDTYLPGLYFKLVEEVNCPILPFDWILYYLAGAKPYLNFYGKSLDENMGYISDLLKKNSQKLFFDVDDWWIPAQKFRLKVWEEKYHVSPVPTFKEIYDYVKEKEGH